MLSLFLKPWIATCHETRDRLSDYLDDELGARTRTRIGRHLSRCKRCQTLLESLTRTVEQLRSFGSVEQLEPAPATVRAVVKRIELEEP